MPERKLPGRWLIDAVQRSGVDTDQLANNLPGPFEAVLRQPDQVSPRDVNLLLNECEVLSGDPHVGLHLIDRVDYRAYGPFGYLLFNSPTVRKLLTNAARYYPIFYSHAELEVSTQGGVAAVGYRTIQPSSVCARHDNEWSLGFFVDRIRAGTDPNWYPDRVSFTNESPGELSELHRVFGANLEFSQPVNCFEFDRALLDRPMSDGDPDLVEILTERADQLLQQSVETWSFESRVRLAIMQQLGQDSGNADAVAEELMVSVSTLKRRLKGNRLTYRQLRANVIWSLAREALARTSASITEIALKLGYSELSAFDRAFKRLEGTSPTRYRRANSPLQPRGGDAVQTWIPEPPVVPQSGH